MCRSAKPTTMDLVLLQHIASLEDTNLLGGAPFAPRDSTVRARAIGRALRAGWIKREGLASSLSPGRLTSQWYRVTDVGRAVLKGHTLLLVATVEDLSREHVARAGFHKTLCGIPVWVTREPVTKAFLASAETCPQCSEAI